MRRAVQRGNIQGSWRGEGGDEWRGHGGREREQGKDDHVYECVKLLAQEETWTKTQHSVVRTQGL